MPPLKLRLVLLSANYCMVGSAENPKDCACLAVFQTPPHSQYAGGAVCFVFLFTAHIFRVNIYLRALTFLRMIVIWNLGSIMQ